MNRGCGGIVLCGGRGRRMGAEKAWLPFGDERMLQRVVRLVATVAEPVIVVAAAGQELPQLPAGVAVVRDTIADRGPLEGLATGLAALAESVELAFVTGTDAPLLAPGWIARLVDLIGPHDLAVPYVAGFHHPLSAVYRRATVLPAIARQLAAGRFRLTDLVQEVDSRIVTAEELRDIDPTLVTLQNLNTPDNYRAALAAAGFDPANPHNCEPPQEHR